MIMHYLGLDHIGHKTGPQGPNMLPKQREMDGIVQQIYKAIETQKHHAETLLVVAGDHGMNAGGNHGGSGPGETEPAMLFASPKFKEMKKRRDYECPTKPKEGTEFHYYTKIEQSDIVPALATMMGMPIPKNSLGVFIRELAGLWTKEHAFQLLHRNAVQILHIIQAKYGKEALQSLNPVHLSELNRQQYPNHVTVGEEEELMSLWGDILHLVKPEFATEDEYFVHAESTFYRFLNFAQDTMSSTASSYDIPRMSMGMAISAIALLLAVVSVPSIWPPSSAGVFFGITTLLYGIMMFASSYVEEEQHFWYWLTPAWVVVLVAKRLFHSHGSRQSAKVAVAGMFLLTTHRLAVRWNQTGQKHAGEPDIVHTIFPQHHLLMWMLVLATYVTNGYFLHTETFAGILPPELTPLANMTLVFLGIVFKLNFTQADAPELVQGLALRIREWSEPFSLVMQAQAVFVILGVTAVVVVVQSIMQARTSPVSSGAEQDNRILLPQRLHHLSTLFLMTQTRAPNIPLFLGLELQRASLAWLMTTEDTDEEDSRTCRPAVAQVATSVLLFSHVYYFCMGGSNSISSLDLSNAYNGVADYNIAAVGVLLFAGNWAGPVWWCSAAILLLTTALVNSNPVSPKRSKEDRDWVMVEREKLHKEAVASTRSKSETANIKACSNGSWLTYVASTTAFVSCGLLAVMAACTTLRTHLFIWTVFSPKYLYAMAWSIGWHFIINIAFGGLLYRIRSIA